MLLGLREGLGRIDPSDLEGPGEIVRYRSAPIPVVRAAGNQNRPGQSENEPFHAASTELRGLLFPSHYAIYALIAVGWLTYGRVGG